MAEFGNNNENQSILLQENLNRIQEKLKSVEEDITVKRKELKESSI